MEKTKKTHTMWFKILASSLAALFLAFVIALPIIYVQFSHFFYTFIQPSISPEVGSPAAAAVAAEGEALAERIVAEGSVLLRNEYVTRNGRTERALPLSFEELDQNTGGDAPRVNVFGWASQAWVASGCGSGRVTRQDRTPGFGTGPNAVHNDAQIGLVQALQIAGVEVNQDLQAFYQQFGQTLNAPLIPGRRPNSIDYITGAALRMFDFNFYRLVEPMQADYPAGLWPTQGNSVLDFSSVGIVVLSRAAGESIDAPRVQYWGNEPLNTVSAAAISDPHRHYFEASIHEIALMEAVATTHETTIVIINSTNVMELGFLEQIEGIDAALFVGATGMQAATAIPRLLFDQTMRRDWELASMATTRAHNMTFPTETRANDAGTIYVRDGFFYNFDEDCALNGSLFFPGITPSGRTASTFAFDMRTAASWGNSGDANQAGPFTDYRGGAAWTGAATGLGVNAAREFGMFYYRLPPGHEHAAMFSGLYPINHATGGMNNNFGWGGGGAANYRRNNFLGLPYIDYAEGIFIGYQWYHTAYDMGFFDDFPTSFEQFVMPHLRHRVAEKVPLSRMNTGSYFDRVVQYPLGHGLSFTTFEWQLTGVFVVTQDGQGNSVRTEAPGGAFTMTGHHSFEVDVLVTNTGNFPGQDVVQLYFTPPWSATRNLERPSLRLLDFAKTPVIPVYDENAYTQIGDYLVPNNNVLMTLSFDSYDMAAYDFMNRSGLVANGGYVLCPGTYYISLRTDAWRNAGRQGGPLYGQFSVAPNYNHSHWGTVNDTFRFSVAGNINTRGDGVAFEVDPITGQRVENRYTNYAGAGGNRAARYHRSSVDGSEGEDITWLSRSSFRTTFPMVAAMRYGREVSNAALAFNLFRQNSVTVGGITAEGAHEWNDRVANERTSFNRPWSQDARMGEMNNLSLIRGTMGGTAESPTFTRAEFEPQFAPTELPANAPNGMTLAEYQENWFANTSPRDRSWLSDTGWHLATASFDDPMWDDLLAQLPRSAFDFRGATEGASGRGQGSLNSIPGTIGTVAIPQIGKPRLIAIDGPNQWFSFSGEGMHGTAFPSQTVTAQTWNVFLAYSLGLQVGTDARMGGHTAGPTFGPDGQPTWLHGLSGHAWLAPGIHVQRSPMNGRNFEYYSEDPLITGRMAAAAIRGAKNRGVYVYLKHLVLYDQESNRDSTYIWITEQALREIYLRPFRLSILEGGGNGIMTGYGRIGATYSGGCYATMTGVVRNEWNFQGAIISDWADHHVGMSLNHKIRMGGCLGMFTGLNSLPAGGTPVTAGAVADHNNHPALRWAQRYAVKRITWAWINAEYTRASFNPFEDPNVPEWESVIMSDVEGGEMVRGFSWLLFGIVSLTVLFALGMLALLYFAWVGPKFIEPMLTKRKLATAGGDVNDNHNNSDVMQSNSGIDGGTKADGADPFSNPPDGADSD